MIYSKVAVLMKEGSSASSPEGAVHHSRVVNTALFHLVLPVQFSS